ncbi:hypothetical protein [Jiella mangrovi]|uniref:Signal recognition particle-docking protein FtsY n=1 Tax=Jiella mangrovi TaxID=2821407 RepID=A0ABS4BHE1_9HYPH|nr:hypothetical protein [Jiella mangrovi]MBP0615484.1 hypothetical protein [Jiella mangrovi]
MAEKKGFFRRIFSFGSESEEERTPEHGNTPRPSDVELGREEAPDPEVRPTAAASSIADSEAGAEPSDEGGITPLKQREDEASTKAETGPSDEAQKKTP